MLINRCIVLFEEVKPSNTVSSFSNSSVPGALFLCPFVGTELISLGDLVDSVVHEHAHQKLYLLESQVALYDKAYVKKHPSPWKDEPRAIGGVLHGYFVFSVLRAFWARVPRVGHPLSTYAASRLARIRRELDEAERTLSKHCPFTTAGDELFASLVVGRAQA